MTIDAIDNEKLWSQRYRPQTIADAILPNATKENLQSFVDAGTIPNLLLHGPAGTGKTTAAMAMCNEIDADFILINASLENGIDTLRTKIFSYATTMSLTGGHKYVILDEADNLSTSAQPALRGLIEEVSSNCGVIMTCNFKNRLIEPLHSRFASVYFNISKQDATDMSTMFMKRVIEILKRENVQYNMKVVASLIKKHFPDFRKVLNELQFAAASGTIDESALLNPIDDSVESLFKILKDKKFHEMRKWVADNADIGATEVFRKMYDVAVDRVKEDSLPDFILQLGEAQFKHAHVADPEINMAAFLTMVMIECEMK